MIKTIKGIALRFFLRNIFLSISSILSICLSVFLIITMFLYISNTKQSLELEHKKQYGDMDLSIGFNVKQDGILDKHMIDIIVGYSEIKQFSKVLISEMQVGTYNGIYTVGVESDSLAKSKYHFNENINNQEVIINQGLANALKTDTGQEIKLENGSYLVKEIIPDLKASGLTNDIILMSRSQLKGILSKKSEIENDVTYILIKLNERVNPYIISSEIKKNIPNIRIDIAIDDENHKRNLSIQTKYIAILSILLLMVAALLIISNFQVFIYKYKKQFAVMRSIGARTVDMFKIIFIQVTIINVIGSLLGYFLSIIANQISHRIMNQIFSTQISGFRFNYVLASIIMILSFLIVEVFMIAPSLKNSKILPFKLMQNNEDGDFQDKISRKKIGKVTLVIGIVFLVFGIVLASTEGARALMIVLFVLFILLSVILLFPFYLSGFLVKLLPVINFLAGRTSLIAVKNIIPQIKRNTFTILTIASLMIITIFGSSMMYTLQKNEEAYIKKSYPTPIVLSTRNEKQLQIKPNELKESILKIEGIDGAGFVSAIHLATIKHNNKYNNISNALADFEQLKKIGLLPPNIILDPSEPNMIISEKIAEKYNLILGDKVDLGIYPLIGQRVLPVGSAKIAFITPSFLFTYAEVLMDWSDNRFSNENTNSTYKFYISAKNIEKVSKELTFLKSEFQGLEINSFEESLKQSKQMFYQNWSLFIIVIIIIILGVMTGVFNTLINNIYSKRKEFAILRTLSVTRAGIVKIILTQVLLYLIVGQILGIMLGLFLTYSMLLLDPSEIIVNYKYIVITSVLMIGVSIIVFIVYGLYISKQNLSTELTEE